ncbi:C40 family peptidase [Streptosporangium longisporum]|uniref:NlpC/P60 domain-containing protein n=1 Tax=Streptosporangium longisporum TaxID=46187 RepID=A0ABP6KH98_9ACTN
MEGTTLYGKISSRVASVLVAGTAVFATPATALAASPLPAPAPPALGMPALKGALRAASLRPAWQKALSWAMSKRGTPYAWGGTGRGGFDCSGLMLRAYGAAGIRLPRIASEQYGAFSRKIPWKDLRPGDLVFFRGLGHVGMITKPGYMVHAPRSGDVVKEERLASWRRASFVGGVRPDPEGVELAERIERATGSVVDG